MIFNITQLATQWKDTETVMIVRTVVWGLIALSLITLWWYSIYKNR